MSTRLRAHLQAHGIGADDLLFGYAHLKNEWAQAQIPTIAPYLVADIPEDLGRTRPNAKGYTYAHGTCTAYQSAPCRCLWCRRAFAIYRAERRARGLDLHTRRPGKLRGENLTDHCPADWFRDNIWKPAVKAAGLRAKTVFHDLRHTHATWLASSPDFDIERLRQRMGHKSISPPRYISASEQIDTDAADILEDRLARPPAPTRTDRAESISQDPCLQRERSRRAGPMPGALARPLPQHCGRRTGRQRIVR